MADNEQVNLGSLRIQRGHFEEARQTRAKRKRLLLIAGGVLLALIVIIMIAGALDPPPTVETATVTLMYPSQIHRVLVASGYVVAQRKAAIASKGSGRIVLLNVVEGDLVKKNDVIARLESGDMEAALGQARANVEFARAALTQAQAEATDATASYTRTKTLMESGSASKSEFDIADARHKRAQAGVQSAQATIKAYEAAVHAAEVQIENTFIRAPFNGTVLTKNADIGEMLTPFGAASNSRGAVVTIADMSSLEVEADVSESNIEKISVGQPCEITLDAFPEKRYRGTVSKVVPTADRAKATVMTKVRFVDLDSRVLPEMSAKVSFLPADAGAEMLNEKPKLVLNPATVLDGKEGKTVFVLTNGALAKRIVTLGAEVGSVIEVLSGVKAGEKLVLKPTGKLSDGMKVAVTKE
jgi:RND family efflux transporter MFP subunit